MDLYALTEVDAALERALDAEMVDDVGAAWFQRRPRHRLHPAQRLPRPVRIELGDRLCESQENRVVWQASEKRAFPGRTQTTNQHSAHSDTHRVCR